MVYDIAFFDGKISMSITPSTRDCIINSIYRIYGAVWHTDLALSFIVLVYLSINPTCSSLAYIFILMGCRKSRIDWILNSLSPWISVISKPCYSCLFWYWLIAFIVYLPLLDLILVTDKRISSPVFDRKNGIPLT